MAGSQQFYQGMPRESAAFRLMKQMGWEEGTGLGKDGQGVKKQIRVKKKEDNSGVGADAAKIHDWSFNTRDFDNLLKQLKVKAEAAKEHSLKDDKEESEDEKESEEEAEKEIKCLKVCRPQGRYKRMERGKLVHEYSEADLKSILGTFEPLKETVDQQPKKKKRRSEAVKPEPVPKPESESESESESEPEEPKPKEVVLVQVVKEDWWGFKLGFVPGGFVGATNTNEKDRERKAFSESDQEKLYNSVQGKATTGKGGLGIRDRPKKIGGARWKGQKITFKDENEDDMQPEENSGESRKKRKRSSESKIKWKKLCKEFLLQAPDQKSSLKKFRKHVLSMVGGDETIESLKKKLSKCSTILIEGNKICLSCEV